MYIYMEVLHYKHMIWKLKLKFFLGNGFPLASTVKWYFDLCEIYFTSALCLKMH